MVFEIGVNLRVTECLDKGDRNYMEDFSKCYFEKVDGSIVFGFFAIFDGHGGSEAANFAKKNLINEIKKIHLFWSENDEEVMSAIKQGFINTHQLMWKEREKWSKTVSGFESTAGTTATIAIVRNKKLYIGHVGDSACVLGYSKILVARTDCWEPVCLTVDHKPSNITEKKRIEKCGGILAKKSGVQRVVWSRPKLNNQRHDIVEGDSIEYEQVPFLAVTRSLGDLWSYDHQQGVYHISPEPDVQCITLDSLEHRCLILGSDGLWNVVSMQAAIEIVRICERETERRVFLDPNINSNFFYNPAASLVKYSISQWKRRRIRADNVSALVIMIDPPGPSMTKRRDDRRKSNFNALNILSSLTCEVPSNENFSKQLTKEFLIECTRWRSANESKCDIEIQKPINLKCKYSQDVECDLNDTSCLSTSVTCQKSPERSIISHSSNKVLVNSSKSKSNDNVIQKVITSDSYYLKFCIGWVNNSKIWNFISEYLRSKGLNNEMEILSFLNSMDSSLCTETLRIMPWIYSAKTSFKSNTQVHISLSKVPLFCNFWLELYVKYIKPLEKSCITIQLSNMQVIFNILKPNILLLLKQYNYIVNLPINEKSIIQNSNEENNENNEIRIKSSKDKSIFMDPVHKSKKHLNVFKVPDNLKMKFFLNSNQKIQESKKSRYSQSGKKNFLKKGPYLLKRSVSEKHLVNTPWKMNARSTSFDGSTDSEETIKISQVNCNQHFCRRNSVNNTSAFRIKPCSLNVSNSNSTLYFRDSAKILEQINENNKNHCRLKKSMTSGHIPNRSYHQFYRNREKSFQILVHEI